MGYTGDERFLRLGDPRRLEILEARQHDPEVGGNGHIWSVSSYEVCCLHITPVWSSVVAEAGQPILNSLKKIEKLPGRIFCIIF